MIGLTSLELLPVFVSLSKLPVSFRELACIHSQVNSLFPYLPIPVCVCGGGGNSSFLFLWLPSPTTGTVDLEISNAHLRKTIPLKFLNFVFYPYYICAPQLSKQLKTINCSSCGLHPHSVEVPTEHGQQVKQLLFLDLVNIPGFWVPNYNVLVSMGRSHR